MINMHVLSPMNIMITFPTRPKQGSRRFHTWAPSHFPKPGMVPTSPIYQIKKMEKILTLFV